MGLCNYYVTSPKVCFSTEDYNEWVNEYCNKNKDGEDDDEKTIPLWFYLPYCDECETYREFTNNICVHHRSHRLLVTCNYCQKDFKTLIIRQLNCSFCCRLIEQKLKTYTFGKLEKLANVYNKKRRRDD